MLKKLIKKVAAPYLDKESADVKLYSYTDGTQFDYEKYKAVQEAGNKRKIDCSWVTEADIDFLSKELLKGKSSPTFGICHGTRQGLEQAWFKKQLHCKVIGTEISETATDYPETIQWDFHEVKPDWSGTADFVYSNSFDHSYDPEKALNAWLDALKPDGVCIIEHTKYHEPEKVTELDPFGARLEIMPYLVLQWTKNAYCVSKILTLQSSDSFDRNVTKNYLWITKS